MDSGVGFPFIRRAELTGDKSSSHDRNGGSYKMMNAAGKDSPVGAREVCFFCCYFRRSNLKDTFSK